MTTQIVLIIAIVFILVGIATALFFLHKIVKALASKTWPSVPGTLESNHLRQVVYKGVDSDGTSDQASALVVDFNYSYSVKGISYNAKRVTFSDSVNKTKNALLKLQKLYQGRKTIMVYYNPDDPTESVLIPGASLFNFTPLITSSLFILAGIYLLQLEL